MNYREKLKSVLQDRIEKNSSYSLRSFAKDISCSPSYLSEVINGRKNLSAKKADIITNLLKLEQEEANLFLDAVKLQMIKKPGWKKGIKISKKTISTNLDSSTPSKAQSEL